MVIYVSFEKKKYKEIVAYKRISNCVKKYALEKLASQHNYEEIVLNYNIVSRKKQEEINNLYLNHNYNTDIITFNLSTDSKTLSGEIYISLKEVRKNALRYGEGIYQEMNRNFIHGLLHLLGKDDKDRKDRRIMKKEEKKYLEYVKKRDQINNGK